MAIWYIYMVRCEGGHLYTGITTDPDRRFEEHRSGRGGAAFFRIRKPLEMRVVDEVDDRSAAQRREAEIKGMAKARKEELFG